MKSVDDTFLDSNAYRHIFDEINDALFVYDIDRETIVDVNQPAAEMFGFDRSELREKTIESLTSGRGPFTAENAQERLAAAIEGEAQIFEWEASDSDGDPFWIEVSIRKTTWGERSYLLVLVRDISSRKEQEHQLEQLQNEYAAVFEHAAEAIFLVDVEHEASGYTFRYARVNPIAEIAMTGYTTGDVDGMTPQEAFGEALGTKIAANYRHCVETGEIIDYREVLPTDEGNIVWETNLAPVFEGDTVVEIVGVARDVTDQIERQQQLEQQNDRLEEFAGVISHDLRNPLNVAQGRAALLASEVESEHLDPLMSALTRMESIVDDTLTLARQGEMVASTEPIDIEEIAWQCWRMVETENATIDIAENCTLQADRDRLRHVFENLFRNAIEHGGEEVTITIGCLEDGFYVEDDGPGIDPGIRETLFSPGATTRPNGTGFGLAIVKRIAEAHGWTIDVPETDGGARFEFHDVTIVERS